MQIRRPICSIREAFPTVPETALLGMLPGLPLDCPVDDLVSYHDASIVFEGIADFMDRHPVASICTVMPGLWGVRDEPICDPELPIRVVTALARLRVTVWGEVLELTAAMLWDIQGFGEGSARDFLAVAARTSAVACCHARPPERCPTLDLFSTRRLPPRLNARTQELRRLMDWAASEMGDVTVADFLTRCAGGEAPEDIKLLLDSLSRTPLSSLFPEATTCEQTESLVNDLYGMLDLRSRVIFASRISLNHLRTLDDLAGDIGVTKERVRQISVRAEERVRTAVMMSRFAPVGWRAHTLSTILGTAVPPGMSHLNDAIERVMKEVPEERRERVLDLLLWLAGPYSWDAGTGWLLAGDLPGHDVIEANSDERGRVEMERVSQTLSESGLLPSVHAAWLEQIGKVICIDGAWLLWTGTVTDKAIRLLELWGEPATPEAIVEAIGGGHDVKATRNRLFDDERVMRVDMTRVGLRSWGMEEYSTIAEEIEQEIDRCGGSAEFGDLIATLIERFNLKETSLRFYASAPMFVVRDGIIRRRTNADPQVAVSPVTDTAGCYVLGPDTLAWRVDVSADTLRGSGRQMPASIAGWLGVLPGSRRSFAGNGGVVAVGWPEASATGPSLGSIRLLAERAGVQLGEQAILRFRRDEATVSLDRLDSATVGAAQGLERLALLTGVSNGDGESSFLHNLGVAIGTRGTRAAVSAELKKRGEWALAALVPTENESPELDAAIDSLKGLF